MSELRKWPEDWQLTNEYRAMLDAAGIEWADWGSHHDVSGNVVSHYERTRAVHPKKGIVSVVWIYIEDADSGLRTMASYGGPWNLECYLIDQKEEPFPFTPAEIMRDVWGVG